MNQNGVKYIFSLFQIYASFHCAVRGSGCIASNGSMFGGWRNAKDLEGSSSGTTGAHSWHFSEKYWGQQRKISALPLTYQRQIQTSTVYIVNSTSTSSVFLNPSLCCPVGNRQRVSYYPGLCIWRCVNCHCYYLHFR